MRRKIGTLRWLAACIVVAGSALVAVGSPSVLSPALYYLFPAEGIEVDVQTLSETACAAGYVVITFSGDTVNAVRGAEPAQGDIDALLAEDHVLVLDGDRFLLHSQISGVSYSLRPAAGAMELVVSAAEETPTLDALAAIIADLQAMGIPAMNIDLASSQSFSATSLKGPAVPTGIALDPALYDLVVAADWFAYAASKGIRLSGLRIEVVMEKVAGGAVPAAFVPFVISETDRLAKLILPVDQLVALAKDGAVGYVRLPLQPVAP
ncbi:MAG: hypothetical protein PHV11_09405 [Candidatus Bipolaricaulis sp.]|nr:hypothetical protein [Candidatus Bipolaricaulis sp.]MDD5220770.1 hypothetical protein [Candidatus Bipolaricaulis sp.]MDD5645840.1 hypothetical protein [Candidatus Bipolaricaulis sp.]